MDIRPDSRGLSRMGQHTEADDDLMARADVFRTHEPALHAGQEEKRLLKLAGNLLVRARGLERRMTAIEAASQACKCARAVAGTVTEILEQTKALLTRMRETPDPEGRRVMARSFNEMLKHIDAIADAGRYDTDNLSRKDSIEIMLDDKRREGFEIAGIDMGCAGLDLLPLEPGRISNAEIIDRLSRVETACNTLSAHGFSYDSIAALLNSRMKFARGMVDILEEGHGQINNSRAGHEAISRAVAEICRTVAEEGATQEAAHGDPAGHRY